MLHILNLIIIFFKKLILYTKFNSFRYHYSNKYIITKNLKQTLLCRKKNLFNKFDYIFFLYSRIKKKSFLSLRLEKKIFIYLVTLVHELSASCSRENIGIKIFLSSEIKNFILLSKVFQDIIPQNISLEIFYRKKKISYNFKKEIRNFYTIYICKQNPNIISKMNYIIMFDFKKKIITNFIINKNKTKNNIRKKLPTFNKTISISKIIQNKKEGVLPYEFKLKNFYYKKYNYVNRDNLLKKKKYFFNLKQKSRMYLLHNIEIFQYGLVFYKNLLVSESLKNSAEDIEIFNKGQFCKKPANPSKIINDLTIVLPTGSNVLSHYICESLKRLYYIKKFYKKKNIKVIVFENIADWLIEIIIWLGIKKQNIIKKPFKESWYIKKLIFLDLEYFELSKNEVNYLCDQDKKDYRNRNIYQKIYISRGDNRADRNLINEKEIEVYLKNQGFKIIYASTLNIRSKLEILNNAKIIVTPLGSALYNFYFCRNIKAKVIVLGSERYFVRPYVNICKNKNLNLTFVETTEIPSFTSGLEYYHSSYFLNKELLQLALDKI